MPATETPISERVVERAEGSPDTARITVSRRTRGDIGMRGLFLDLDGHYLANLKFGDSISQEIAAGHHKLRATNRLYTKLVEFEVAAGQTAQFRAANVPFRGVWFFLSAFGTMIYNVQLARLPGQEN